jgi:predicted SnoaL-like aldol condensation-catalyzing enzyme
MVPWGAVRGKRQLEKNKQLVLEFFRRVFDAQDADALKEFLAPDYRQHVRHMPSGLPAMEAMVRAIFPHGPRDVSATLGSPPDLMIAEGDMVVTAAYRPQPDPDFVDGAFDFFVFDAFKIKDGRIIEHWSSIKKDSPPKPPK